MVVEAEEEAEAQIAKTTRGLTAVATGGGDARLNTTRNIAERPANVSKFEKKYKKSPG